VGSGAVTVPDELQHGDLAAFEPSDEAIEFEAQSNAEFSSAYGTHSMRRTKAAQIYKKTGNLRAVQLLLGHTKLESTVRYLGIELDDALANFEQVEL
jgi:site-specific recombinase XerC